MSAPAWDIEWAAEHAATAMKYLSVHCPASSGRAELHPFMDEAHEAAVAGDPDAYLVALRSYVRRGQDLQKQARKVAA